MLRESFELPAIEPVPQIKESGISADYINEFAAINLGVSISKSNPNMSPEIMAIIKDKVHKFGKLMLTYEERFPHTKYSDVITEKNREAIKKINELAEKCNEKFNTIDSDPELSDEQKLNVISERIFPFITKIKQLIDGKEDAQ